jgi:ADP-ribose pyrophosphatase YjhB (NUDIX family)
VIVFDRDSARFNFRVAAVAIRGGRVLVHRRVDEDFWSLPGGRVEMRETTREALAREMREELGVRADVGRLLWIVENFFDYDARAYHELSFFYRVRLPARFPRAPFRARDGRHTFAFHWHALAELRSLALRPSFLVRSLRRLPAGPAHVVHIDGR